MKIDKIQFPQFKGIRCLMMPYIQGEVDTIPDEYESYKEILSKIFFRKGDVGYLTIDESEAIAGNPHRGARAKHGRALHTEAGRHPDASYQWGGNNWGGSNRVTLNQNVEVLLANNLDDSCALWDSTLWDTTEDGDIGHLADQYPYEKATFMKAGEVHKIGILTPHESIPVKENVFRQFLRIVSSGVNGREEYFTQNPLLT